MTKARKDTKSSMLGSSILWYIVFGAVHEIGHILAALAVMVTNSDQVNRASPLPFNVFEFRFWYELLISRQVTMDLSSILVSNEDASVAVNMINCIHHAGWILSLFLAVVIAGIHNYLHSNRRRRRQASTKLATIDTTTNMMLSSMQLAAWLTALESIATDLCGVSTWWGGRLLPSSFGTENDDNIHQSIFWCGNFGILLLHHLWLKDSVGRDSALDCLEQMVQITMMRGAQSGGVVTFQPTGSSTGGLKGTRCRVVNKKRTDLSKELRKRISIPKGLPSDFYPFLAGHTRFATSSKAALEGTHPHQWTPPTSHHIFDFSTQSFSHKTVEIFITHNGDLEFYQLNGKTNEAETILTWLGTVLELSAPAPVDSMAIAGLMDVIRCQGCFALAARYAVAMGMAFSTMDGGKSAFPTKADWEMIGSVFEECWNTMLSETKKSGRNESEADIDSNSVWGDSITMRAKLAGVVTAALRTQPDVLQPLNDSGILLNQDDEEGSNSLYAFCTATIHAFLDNDLFYSAQMFLKRAKGSFGLVVSSSWDAHRQVVIAARGQTVRIITLE
jgi:hypothetical protein